MATNTDVTTLHPLIQWAQSDKLLFLTVEIDDVQELQIGDKSLHVKGTHSGSKAVYEASVDLYAGVEKEYRKINNDRHLELVINKEVAHWWPRLAKSSAKLPWVKIDFNKWKDEDEEDDDVNGGDLDFQNYMSKLDSGGSGAPNLDDFDDEDDEDKDGFDDMPDLEDDDDVKVEGGKIGTVTEQDVKVDNEKKVAESGESC
ncbi:unnamed protein product [Thelazia callipaeda]|uniref:CS domain-containing protein n=1 Tax=Thelazia callipaeda TaxID=103827 RepID=A0A0N5CYG4_THECL|nr:unnamed protein product [Thelazia callipaeda]